jgi:hypothetical protein
VTPVSTASAAEYVVYSVAMDSIYSKSPAPRHVVVEMTKGEIPFGRGEDGLVSLAAKQIPGLPPELLDAWRTANRAPSRLAADRFSTRKPVRLARPAPADSFRTRLSRVGFTEDQTQAVLHLIDECGSRCGTGRILWLQKSENKWTIRDEQQTVQF